MLGSLIIVEYWRLYTSAIWGIIASGIGLSILEFCTKKFWIGAFSDFDDAFECATTLKYIYFIWSVVAVAE